MKLPDPYSFWVASAPREPRPPLDTDLDTDVCVIGGGIAGILAAYALHDDGRRVVLIDARELGRGVTGHSTAKITSSHGLIYTQIERSFGSEGAAAYGGANEAGKELIRSIIDQHSIACDLETQDNYVYTEQRDKLSDIRAEVDAARRARLPASFVTSTPLPYPVEGAVRFTDQSQFHPRKFTNGLIDVLSSEGIPIFESTSATSVTNDARPRVETSTGYSVTADHVVVATHLPFLDRGLFFAKAHPYRSYVVAGHLDNAPDGMHISTGDSTRSIRRTPDGDRTLLLVSGEGHKTGHHPDTNEPYRKLADFAAERLGVTEIAYRWAAHDYVPVDHVPYIGRVTRWNDRVLTATGFAKWGFANGAVAAMILRDAIAGRDNPWASLFDAKRIKPLASAYEFTKENAQVAVRFVADRVDRTSPRCTHMGCVLKWNNAETTWDCPCHGSRFDANGKVIEGPAVRDLDPDTVPLRSSH